MERSNTKFLIGAMNLLAVASPALANQEARPHKLEHKIEKLNAASLSSMESSWIKVPIRCKARGFNASPVVLEKIEIGTQIQSIYASFSA